MGARSNLFARYGPVHDLLPQPPPPMQLSIVKVARPPSLGRHLNFKFGSFPRYIRSPLLILLFLDEVTTILSIDQEDSRSLLLRARRMFTPWEMLDLKHLPCTVTKCSQTSGKS